MNQNSIILLQLSLIEGIGPGVLERIISQIKPEQLLDLYNFSATDLRTRFGVQERIAQKLYDGLRSTQLLEQELSLIEKNQISWVTSFDPSYPSLLKTIHLPPLLLYFKGILPANNNAIAIVGSREANHYGNQVIEQLVPALVAHDWIIVSGGALGADTMAHEATLRAGGATIAVLGSGLLRPYPPENKKLFNKIVDVGGAIVSPYPLLMEPLPWNFPGRNRVIAGLSRGCIVVQAAAKSGARITADFALSQSREVFAVPGSIDDRLSVGCHELIRQGATLISSAADVLNEFGYDLPKPERDKKPKKDIQQTSLIPATLAIPVDPVEAIIITACQNPSAVDELLEATGLPLIQLSKMLFDLQLKGKITQNIAGLWESF